MSDPFAPGLLARLPQPPRKVAIVRASRIGDFLCAVPAFHALRTLLPGAEITLIGLPFVADLVARSPHLDRFVPFPGWPGIADQFFEARTATDFLRAMQAEAFDLAIQLHGSGVYGNPFTLLLGAGATAGFIRPGDYPARLDAALPLPDSGHEIARALALPAFLADISLEILDHSPEFPLWPQDHAEAAAALAGYDPPFIGLHPASREPEKCWPVEHYAALGRELRRQYGGTVVIVAGPDDVETAAHLAEAIGEPCRNLAGRTALGPLGAVLARLAVFLTNDSGPAHIAYALGTPSVTLFGPTDPARWGATPRPAPSPRQRGGHRAYCGKCRNRSRSSL